MDDVVNELQGIKQSLEKQNEIVQQMLNIMPRPVGKATRVLEIALLIVGISSVIGIADIIMKWIIGDNNDVAISAIYYYRCF